MCGVRDSAQKYKKEHGNIYIIQNDNNKLGSFMKLFSHRHKFKPIKATIQRDGVDEDLRNRLWSVFIIAYKDKIKNNYIQHNTAVPSFGRNISSSEKGMIILVRSLWQNYFKKPVDTLNNEWSSVFKTIRTYFFECEWFEVYDFIEFIANNYPERYDRSINSNFIASCNAILEQELSAYRFVGGHITQITSDTEIGEIEEALMIQDSLSPVKIHLERALDLLADRKSPDYRNSIKESISAVEAICRSITNNDNASLGTCLKKIEHGGKFKVNPALSVAFSKLYGYTSSGDEGIRHALLKEDDLDFEDAKLMLVLCSGFINYLIVKSSKE